MYKRVSRAARNSGETCIYNLINISILVYWYIGIVDRNFRLFEIRLGRHERAR